MFHIAAMIMAAGSGERFEGIAPKQLALVGGRPMVAWSIERLANFPDVKEIYLVIPQQQTDAWRATLAEPSGGYVSDVVQGGERRQDSVRLGLEALPADATHVLVHDAARPCLSVDLLERIVAALRNNAAVVPVLPAVDTLVVEAGGVIDAVLDRANVSGVQTPQGFEKGLLLRAHRRAYADEIQSNDDGSLVLALGEMVKTIPGDRANIKVTYPEDVVVAEAMLDRMR